MKKISLTMAMIGLTIVSFAQFDSPGFTFGMQGSRNLVKPGYVKYNNDLAGSSKVTAQYNDKFNFVHFDFRYLGVSDNMMLTFDGSAIPDLLAIIGMLVAGKEDLNITGKLKMIDDHFGSDAIGYGSDWSYVQTSIMFGGGGFYLGGDFDLGAWGVNTVKNTDVLLTGGGYYGVGGAMAVVSDKLRTSLRVDKLWLGNYSKQTGLGIVLESDFCLGENFYVGAFYKYRKFGEKEWDNGGTEVFRPKVVQNSIGLRAGFWINS